MSGVDFMTGPSFEVVLAGKDVRELRRALFAQFVPNKVVLQSGVSAAPFTKEQKPIGGKPTAYVCTNRLCKLPTSDPQKMIELLDHNPTR
jgi:uncharacterized protein YyaL (SSP411 family)